MNNEEKKRYLILSDNIGSKNPININRFEYKS